MAFMAAKRMEVAGLECMVARSGYTGEDGFEIVIPPGSGSRHNVVTLWEVLMAKDQVMPIGLGARDSLRLEVGRHCCDGCAYDPSDADIHCCPPPFIFSNRRPTPSTTIHSDLSHVAMLQAGLCLYGSDLDDTTSPVEGSLLWVIAKRRRAERGSFVGSQRILNELENKSAARKRAGFVVQSGAPVREGVALYANGEQVGVTTSGGFSPCLKKGIGMCYVTPAINKVGTELQAEVRGKMQMVTVAKMPFVSQNYYRCL